MVYFYYIVKCAINKITGKKKSCPYTYFSNTFRPILNKLAFKDVCS